MKRLLYLFLFISSHLVAQIIPSDKNAIIHSRLRVATTNEADALDPNKAAITISYIDGLGRPLQTIGYQQSPNKKDIVLHAVEFDKYGRIIQTALPSPTNVNTGTFQENAFGLANTFYGDNYAFTSTTKFDNSPLNRTRVQFGAGNPWRTENKKLENFDESAGTDVRYYYLDANGNIVLSGTYPTNSLYKKRTIDEQGHTRIEIKDKRGRLVQQQQQDANGYATTYYLYDGMGRILAAIQPEGYELNQSINKNSDTWNKWVFWYDYDPDGRMRIKHIPASGDEYFVYDKWDRLVWSQTALQRELGKWSFYKYDVFNREIMRGEKAESRNLQALETEAWAWSGDRYESRVGGGLYYSYSNAYPQLFSETDIRHVTYYDNYNDWLPSGMAFSDGGTAFHTQHDESQSLLVGTRTRSSLDNSWLVTAWYYDDNMRIIRTFSQNVYGQIEMLDTEFNFAGEVIQTKKQYKGQDGTVRTKQKQYTLDHVGRKTAYNLTIGNLNARIANYEYDEIGRLKEKIFLPNGTFEYGGAKDYIIRPSQEGSVTQANTQDIARKAIIIEPSMSISSINLNSYYAGIDPNASQGTSLVGLQKINYKWHIRGGLLGINLDANNNPNPASNEGDLFAYKLDYESAGQWDGNIGKETWKSAKNTGSNRSYSYTYDPLKRLKSAIYAGGMYPNENFSIENINYDKNGNIQTFWRKGMTAQSNGTPTGFDYVDKMQYSYEGNRLLGISDGINGNLDVSDFRDNGSSSDYTYWTDGSLKSDGNRGISSIEWDTFLNKIKQINYSDGRWLKNFYDGAGTKLKTTDSEGNIWEYDEDLIFKNSVFYQINDDEGRILYENGAYVYEFSYKDHLGNTRVSFKAIGNQLIETQENAYYPFGLSHTGTDFKLGVQPNNFLYNGKERINSFGLNIADYGFRTQDLLINRFWSRDPLAEKFPHNGVYNYAENRPIDGIDLDGLEFFRTVDKGITTIGAKVKFENLSNADAQRVQLIKSEIQNTFNQVIQSANSSYQGQIIYDDKATLSINLSEQTIKSPVKGVSGLGVASIVNNSVTDNGSQELSIGNVAVNGVHELLHNGGIEHPTDVTRGKTGEMISDNPIKDTELKLIKKEGTYEYQTTPNTVKNIYNNVMIYGKAIINGQKVNNVRGGNENAKSLSPGQLKVVEDNIKKGKINGEATN